MSGQAVVKRAVLLAAGRGTRLRPHTDTTPKPLLVHKGKPTLDYLLESLLHAEVDDVVLVTHHLSEQVQSYADAWMANHKQQLRCVHQTHLIGTANALQTVFEVAPDIVQQPFILSATDYLLPRDFFGNLVGFHESHNAQLTVSMKQLDALEMAGRSSIRFNEDQSIAEIVEKPPAGTAPSSIGANLTFILPEAVVPYVEDVPMSARGEHEVQQAINAWLNDGGQAQGLLQPTPTEWQSPD